jgi:zinc protease
MDIPRPRRTVLENGLTVLSVRRRGAPSVAVMIVYGAGTIHEPPDAPGLAHLTEHMMFRGTPTFPEGRIDELTGSLGGVNNAVTTSDYAAYYFVLPPEHWAAAVEIEADRMLHCELTPAAFETERRIAIEERFMLDDDPDAVLDETLDRLALGTHPYGVPVIGRLEYLERATPAEVRSFYEARYVPGNACLVVAGDLEHEAVLDAAARSCGGAPARRPPPLVPPPDPPARFHGREVVEVDTALPRVALGFHGPAALDRGSAALELTLALLGNGRSSRLYSALVADLEVATDVSALRLLQRFPGVVSVVADVPPGGDPGACEEAILEVLAGLRSRPPDAREIAKARRLARLDRLSGLETVLGVAGYVGFWESLGGWELGAAHEERERTAEPDEIRCAADQVFDPSTRSAVWLVPATE